MGQRGSGQSGGDGVAILLSVIAIFVSVCSLGWTIYRDVDEPNRIIERIQTEIEAEEADLSYVVRHRTENEVNIYDFLVRNAGGQIAKEEYGTFAVQFTNRIDQSDVEWKMRLDEATVEGEVAEGSNYVVTFSYMGRGSEFRFEIWTEGFLFAQPILSYANTPYYGRCDFEPRYMVVGGCAGEAVPPGVR